MVLVTMNFAVLGFLSPSNRGALMTAMLLLWVFMGLFAGYSSARLYKMFKGTEWKKITLSTAFMFPAVVFAIFFVLNSIIWGEKSSGAVPFTTMFALVLLWFGISVPLVFLGSYIGFKQSATEDPVKTNKIPRQIPEQAWYMNPILSILVGGILPFGAVFIELFFILTSIWLQQFYYIFGFLFLVFLILVVTCVEITIVLCYFQLCSEDYLWWWRCFLTQFEMREPQMCRIVCRITLNDNDVKAIKEKIDDEYCVNMILDNLPLVVPIKRLDRDSPTVYQHGFYVGVKGQYNGSRDEKYFIHNHLSFLVKYHEDEQLDVSRIVGFEVKPFSVKHEYEGEWNGNTTRLSTCDPHAQRTVSNSDYPQEVEANKGIIFTYDVEFKESDVKWASRWDTYLLMADDQIHWFSIVNSLMIVLFLSGMVAMIMLRTLYRDISKYNQLETQEEAH
ncbi:hypothetical protein COCNU_01G004960 [Cocos nucifera]|uniref:Transmembrane 9 superfamily member n=1 Tax=Cocos nucifera TaxID=13894 RepID=A0A8K0MU78_COCNU|nr:hypothetical protein COCNU_01G004960 [Cocos nucifera]